MASFSLTLSPVGVGTLVVDGQDITRQAAAVDLHAAADQPTVLTIHTVAGGHIDGDGIVQVAAQPDEDAVREAIAEWLEGIDLEQWHNDATRMLDASCNLQGAYHAALLRYARGEQ